ncbi:MAG: 4-hydroxybenzoate octaprenyltransferase [Firmicutes bacterium]|nr:4-hydroxybenzoate octaprenyltransferase [Bacillota bacterium]
MKNFRKIRGLIELLRPELPFAAGVCVIIGEMIASGSFPSSLNLVLGFIWGFFLSSPAMIINDYFDIEVDRVNSSHRPLASGLIQPASAIVLAIITTVIGLITSIFIDKSAFLLYIILWLIGFLYNWKLKETGLLGNALVGISVASTFIVGGILVGKPWSEGAWLLSLIVFLFDLGEEIAADAMDIEGDKKRNVKSIAILIGKKNALYISALLFVLVILLTFHPVLLNLLGTSYVVIISVMDFMICFLVMKLLKSLTAEAGRSYIRKIYLSALVGLLIIMASRIFV